MRFLFLFVFISLLIAHEGEKEHHEEEIILTKEQMELLGIRLMKVEKKPASKIMEFPATVEEYPKTAYKVYSPIEGIVRKVYKFEGDYVRKDEPLLEVFSPYITELITRLERTKGELIVAEKVFKEYEKLYRQKLIRYREYLDAKTRYESLKGTYEALLGELRSFGKIKGRNLLITSPGEGYVVSQKVFVGSGVGIDKLLYEVHNHERVWVYAWVSPEELKEVRSSKRFEVLVEGERIVCSPDYVGHEVDEKTRKVKVRCTARNEDHKLLPGMFVKVKVYTGKDYGIIVPKSAVKEIEGKHVVFLFKEGKFIPKEVVILKNLGKELLIEGIHEGEVIAVEGTNFLKTKITGIEEGGHAH
ncbi:CzcB/NccB family metal efflux transporter periplasmic adaptor subunit [Aquifex pyrophilus]